MLDYGVLFGLDPFGLRQSEKEELYRAWVADLGNYHKEHCLSYRRLCQALGDNPMLPVSLFKMADLKSVSDIDVQKTMTSSGTTGQKTSKIFLDRDTSMRQSKALASIVTSFVGKKRPPMLIIDSKSVVKDRRLFSARGAGILGFSMLGRDVTYALDDSMGLDIEAIETFAEKHAGERCFLFGFTFMIWQYFYRALKEKNIFLDIDGVLVHGGGWKKLESQSIDNERFRQALCEVTNISHVLNYYGMVEQTGSIFLECECGHLHASVFSDVNIIDPDTFERKSTGRGLISCVSLLPTSYPGHILLTEDEGEILGVDDCSCGRYGKYFKVYGRIKGAEIRGCSDTYER